MSTAGAAMRYPIRAMSGDSPGYRGYRCRDCGWRLVVACDDSQVELRYLMNRKCKCEGAQVSTGKLPPRVWER